MLLHESKIIQSEEYGKCSTAPVAYHHFFGKTFYIIFLRNPRWLRMLFVTPGCHLSMSLLVVAPPCRFDRRAEKRENLVRPGSYFEDLKK